MIWDSRSFYGTAKADHQAVRRRAIPPHTTKRVPWRADPIITAASHHSCRRQDGMRDEAQQDQACRAWLPKLSTTGQATAALRRRLAAHQHESQAGYHDLAASSPQPGAEEVQELKQV
jgi:hypothetical protein